MAPNRCQRCKHTALKRGKTGDDFCIKCGWNKKMQERRDDLTTTVSDQAKRLETAKRHSSDLLILTKRDPTIIKLLVGPDKVILHFPRAVLSFRSAMMESAFYGHFSESTNKAMELPDDVETQVAAFAAWAQTGVVPLKYLGIDDDVNDDSVETDDGDEDKELISPYQSGLLKLWIFGDKILAEVFCNSIMEILLQRLDDYFMLAPVARFIFDNTALTSKLRSLVVDTILSEGPFKVEGKSKAESNYKQSWLKAIEQGGDLIQALCLAGGFSNSEPSRLPYKKENRHKYMVNEKKGLNAEDWRKNEF